MKQIFIILLVLGVLASCKNNTKTSGEEVESVNLVEASFGEKITNKNSLKIADAVHNYDKLSLNDSIGMKFTGIVKDVCKAKGCWMKIDMENGEEIMVKFKDYGFFVPEDITGKKVVMDGKAFIKESSIEEQKHLAEDGGATEEEIAEIQTNKKTYSFLADGVLIVK